MKRLCRHNKSKHCENTPHFLEYDEYKPNLETSESKLFMVQGVAKLAGMYSIQRTYRFKCFNI